jgi:hypothetical protein
MTSSYGRLTGVPTSIACTCPRMNLVLEVIRQ